MKYYNNDCLMHYGVKGMKWGVRRYQKKDGSLTPAGKKRYSQEDGPEVTTQSNEWGTSRKLTYVNNSQTNEKKALDKLAEDENYYDAGKFDYEFNKYARNCREKGEEYADKILHDNLKNYSYTFVKNTENWDGEEYVMYSLKVMGDKNFYATYGEEDYSDDQWFGKLDK